MGNPQTESESASCGHPLQFFLLVFALTIPFWGLDWTTRVQLLPGLPISALAVVCPAIAAAILVFKEHRIAGVIALLKRSADFDRIKIKVWYAPALLWAPMVMVLSFAVLRLMRMPVAALHFQLLSTLGLCLVCFMAAMCEELGWSGYAIDPMQARGSALQASLAIGVVWAVWHFPALAHVNRAAEWIAWWSLGTIATRVIIVWLYNNTGKSVFAAALFHAGGNIAWQLFPVDDSYFYPRITGIISACVATIVVVVWGPRTLTRQNHESARSNSRIGS